MLLDRGSRSRGMIGLRLERHTTADEPAGRSSHGMAAASGLPAGAGAGDWFVVIDAPSAAAGLVPRPAPTTPVAARSRRRCRPLVRGCAPRRDPVRAGHRSEEAPAVAHPALHRVVVDVDDPESR